MQNEAVSAVEGGILERWRILSAVARAYYTGLFVFGAALVLAALRTPSIIINGVFYIAMTCLSVALIREGYEWAKLRMSSPLYKMAGGILAIMAATLATASSALTLGDATGQDPAYFKLSVALLAPVTFLPVLAFIVMLSSLLVIPLVMLLSIGKQMFKGEDSVLIIARLLACVCLSVGAAQLLNPSMRLDDGLKRIASYSAYTLDMHSDLSCSTVSGDRITRLNDSVVIVGRITAEGPRFARRSCPLASQALELPPPKLGPTKIP